MKFPSKMVSKAKGMFIPAQGKEKGMNGGSPIRELDCSSSRKVLASRFSTGSKEDIFFDSKGWIDSDCEDDYYNASGDFAPSQGSTPDHPVSIQAPPHLNKVHFVDDPEFKPETSPTEKKNLSEFLQENPHGDVNNDQTDVAGKPETNVKLHSYVLESSQPLNSSGQTTNSSGAQNSAKKKDTWKNRHCCLPSLMHTRSFSVRRKHKLSHEHLNAQAAV